uniref:Inositol oxygenase n=1 Tax=Phytophthora ramorum TaxID=164328 RepID=H3HC44_PHYRM
MATLSLGACVAVTEALPAPAARFRLQFTDDRRTKELRWVLFASTQRGAVGKLIFTLEKNGTAHVKSVVVNKEFRGLGLARVLYLATLGTLEEKMVHELYLEAEEDSKRHGRLVGLYREGTWFCMMALQTADGTCLVAGEDGAIEVSAKCNNGYMWQTLLGAKGQVFLRSVHGKFLCVEEDGTILANRPCNSTWETFQVVPQHGESFAQNSGGVALRSFHGSYLCIDPLEKRVQVSDLPVPWDGGDIMSLTIAFVTSQMARYGDLHHATMSVPEACKCAMELTGDSERGSSWVIKYMLATAAAVKNDGHPDWLQLSVFLRALGMLFLCWTNEDDAALRSISAREWLVKNSTWVVGEPIPSSIAFSQLNELNSDHCKAEKGGSVAGHGGLENVVLPWTPDEYLHRVLSLNKTTLPAEALDVVRFWSLKTWYEQDNYDELCAPQDMDTKEWISSISKVACVSEEVIQKTNVDDELPYYLQLADKYLPDTLQW